MSKKQYQNIRAEAMPYNALLGGVIIIFTHNLLTAELVSFFWLDDYGWCFDWYDNEHEKEIDCKTYGIFPNDYIDQNGDYENDIKVFLEDKPKDAEIPALDFIEWLRSNAT